MIMTPEEALEAARDLLGYCRAEWDKPGLMYRWNSCKGCVFFGHNEWCMIKDPLTWGLRYMEEDE